MKTVIIVHKGKSITMVAMIGETGVELKSYKEVGSIHVEECSKREFTKLERGYRRNMTHPGLFAISA